MKSLPELCAQHAKLHDWKSLQVRLHDGRSFFSPSSGFRAEGSGLQPHGGIGHACHFQIDGCFPKLQEGMGCLRLEGL